MKAKIKYTNEPLGDLRVVEDFLPKPEDLVFKEDNVKVTITLSKSSVDFFKSEAKKNNTQYQKMIRRLLDLYASRYQNSHLSNR
jgi:predicted DNA binding CopG/RHH family protein